MTLKKLTRGTYAVYQYGRYVGMVMEHCFNRGRYLAIRDGVVLGVKETLDEAAGMMNSQTAIEKVT